MILVCRLNVGYEKEDENCLKRIGLINKIQTSAVLLASMISAIIFPWVFKGMIAIIMPSENISK